MKEEGLSWTPIYAQHYTQTNRAESERQIKEAVQAGASGIIVTVDVPAMGNREADKQIKVSKPGEKPGQDAGLAAAQVSLWDANLKWDDVKWAQSLAPGKPIIVKGISTVADVALAKRYGAAGVFLSNHGVSSCQPGDSLTRISKSLSCLCVNTGPSAGTFSPTNRHTAEVTSRTSRPAAGSKLPGPHRRRHSKRHRCSQGALPGRQQRRARAGRALFSDLLRGPGCHTHAADLDRRGAKWHAIVGRHKSR